MSPSSRLGATVVLSAAVLGALFSITVVGPIAAKRAGSEFDHAAFELGDFRFVERSGLELSAKDFSNEVWIASFIFTRCPSSCPRIVARMRELQESLEGTRIRLASISVDPDHDTPEVLRGFAERNGADPERWRFLSGSKSSTYDLILNRFRLPLAEAPSGEVAKGAEAVSHSDRLALVDEGNRVIGFYGADDPEAIRELVAKAKQRDGYIKPGMRYLPIINASLNGMSGLLLIVALILIKSGRARAHAACMVTAVSFSLIFLACYLVYHWHVGSMAFRGEGFSRILYFTILTSHTMLAAFGVVPLVPITLARALKKRFDRHVAIAKVSYPIWLYVSITGVVIYVMLYQLDLADRPLPS